MEGFKGLLRFIRRFKGPLLFGSVVFGGILVAAAVFVWRIAETFTNPTDKWTAIAAVLTGAAFLVALIGLPAALLQLLVVRRQLARVPSLLEKLRDLRARGAQLFPRRNDPSAVPELDEWIKDVRTFIRTDLHDEAEEMRFRNLTGAASPTSRMDKTDRYLRNELWPRVKEGYW